MKNTISAATILAVLTLALACCVVPQARGVDFGDLRRYETADPDVDLKAAIKKDDLRFKAINGYGVHVPGVQDEGSIKKYGTDIINGTSDVIDSYEHGRLMTIAQHYSEHYNMALLNHINLLDSREMAIGLNGYAALTSKMRIEKEMTGDINMLPYSFHASLVSLTRQCVRRAWWFDPIINGKPQYDWLQFLEVYREVEDVACGHKWIQAWIDAGRNRAVEAHIFGVRPYTEWDFDSYVRGAWSDAQLRGDPYYELLLRSNDKAVATIYVSKDRSVAIITSLGTKKEANDRSVMNAHWLDGKEFMYYPKARTKELIVVDQSGTWFKKMIDNTTKP